MKRATWLAAALLAVWPATAVALPDRIAQEGLIVDEDGNPLDGRHRIRVRLYAQAAGGAAFYAETHPEVEFFSGYYFVDVGSIEPLDISDFARPQVWMGITLDDHEEMRPRTPLGKVPAAFVADVAENVVGDITPRTVSIDGIGPVIDANGRWVGDPTGLRGAPGPEGARGPVGPAGPQGERGPAGAAGEGVDVEDVVPAIVADIQRNPGRYPFIRKNANDSTTGDLTFNGGHISFNFGNAADALRMNNNNITGVNRLEINDPGDNEGIRFGGTAARIVVSGPGGENRDGPLRLINDGDGIRLEADTRVVGDVSISGAITEVQRIVATVIQATTLTAENANLGTLTGPNGRTVVNGQLVLNNDVVIGNENVDFIGTLRTGNLAVGAHATVGQNLTAANLRANASISAGGNIEAQNDGLVRAGNGGFWVNQRQVFDRNGNLLARPQYACPAGRLMFGTDANGVARCVNVTCPAGQAFRGFDGNLNPICEVDDQGLASVPANSCPEGQAVVRIEANGRTHCGAPRAAQLRCPEGEFMVGVNANGSVICDDAPEGGGGGQPLRANVLVCNGAGLNVAAMLQGQGEDFQVANGCAPNDQTQAMLISRRGNGQYNAAAVRAYVQGGGVVLTEYSHSHTVFTHLFQQNVGQGSRRGQCSDNINPPARFNLNDDFWTDNRNVAQHQGNSGCGYQIDHFPGVTRLGGWAVNQTFLGYRDLGEGRVWFVDVDWQDGEGSFTNESRVLMTYMIKNRAEGGGGDDVDLFEFEGVRQNTPDNQLAGWRRCHTSRFNETTNGLQALVNGPCRGEKVMIGCRPAGDANWRLLAQGRHAQVFRDVGRGNNLTRENGVDFYYNNSYSMGFVQAGSGVSRNSCDTRRDPGDANRMCWHTSGDRITSGYRCGNTFLNGNNGWERAIWVSEEAGGGGAGDTYASCKVALGDGQRQSGVFSIRPPGEAVTRRVWCDQTTDGGGWTLVASTRDTTLDDYGSGYYDDLQTLAPNAGHNTIWNGLRQIQGNFDVRFTCRNAVRAAGDPMTVDLSFYDVNWYSEWANAANDGASCFEEGNGGGDTQPAPMRKNNLNGAVRNRGDNWNCSGYLEGEDSCGDTGDFTVDWDDRGMDCNQGDGTDWGEDDGARKCGANGLGGGQWFIYARERGDAGGGGGGGNGPGSAQFSGIHANVAAGNIDGGWRVCHDSGYEQGAIDLNGIQNACNGAKIMYGCRQDGAASWQVLAMGDRAQVFRNTGDRNNNLTQHNDVAWYFSGGWSIGITAPGTPVNRNSCDVDNNQPEKKICWHTSGNRLNGGWRCGANRSVGNGWQRVIWTR